jgi:protein-S-isoprenylcysteine O-methyltransferase Ste14
LEKLSPVDGRVVLKKESMMKSKFEQLRIPVSRILAVLGACAICKTTSFWEEGNKLIEVVLFMIGAVLVAMASLGRMWCSLYIAGYKNKELITSGPYSLCRNPLYFFSMLGIVGIGFATETFTFALIFGILFALYYPNIIKREEDRLAAMFFGDFEDYKKKVPSFFPRVARFEESSSYTVNTVIYRRHIFSALWFVWIIGIIELLGGLKELGLFGSLWVVY